MSTDHADSCAASAPKLVKADGSYSVIDIHCHYGVAAAEAVAKEAEPAFPPKKHFASPETMEANKAMFGKVGPLLYGSLDVRIAEMDRLGIDIQAIAPTTNQYYYELEAEHGLRTSQAINNGIADAMAKHPDRFVGLCNVPLQDERLAIQELRRCVNELGMRGVQIGTNVNGAELADPKYNSFFAAAEELGVVVLLHPDQGFTHGDRLSCYHLNNIIGNPLETTIALAHLIFGGVLDRHQGLKLATVHGGGFMPAYFGRYDHAWRNRADCHCPTTAPPSTYLRRIYVDTLVFDKQQRDALIAVHPHDRICLGTDYPFDMAEPDPCGFHADLPNDLRRKIMSENPAALLGID